MGLWGAERVSSADRGVRIDAVAGGEGPTTGGGGAATGGGGAAACGVRKDIVLNLLPRSVKDAIYERRKV
jgi:hypothetical protein